MKTSIFATVVVACSFFSQVLIGCSPAVRPHPSDRQLEDNFTKHRKDFELLVEMVKADSHVIRIDHDFTWLTDNASWPRPESELGLTVQRWDDYKAIFTRLNLSRGLQTYPNDGQIFLIASSQGLVIGGSNKGYVYSAKLPTSLRESLDGDIDEELGARPVYKRIDENWYLYFRN